MPKIAIVDKIHSDGIKLLEDNPKFQYEIVENLSKKNLQTMIFIKNFPKISKISMIFLKNINKKNNNKKRFFNKILSKTTAQVPYRDIPLARVGKRFDGIVTAKNLEKYSYRF